MAVDESYIQQLVSEMQLSSKRKIILTNDLLDPVPMSQSIGQDIEKI